jgi:MarR family 2-MHQ and catechol resistance regulon transcriptional repressor
MSEASRNYLVALEGLMEAFQQEQRGLFRDWKMTPVQFFVLRWVSKDKEANMSKLAALLGVRPQTVTPIVDTLERSGWVRRVRSTEDRRESFLRLTPRGRRLLASVRASFFEKLGRALDEAPARSLGTATEVLQIATTALVRELAAAPAPIAPPKRPKPGPSARVR